MMLKFYRLLFLAGLLWVPGLAEASKTTYVFTDRKFTFVKREELKEDELKDRQINQPYTFTEQQLRNILSGLKLSKEAVFKKDVEEKDIFDQASLDRMVPLLVKAFQEAKPNEEVVFSYVIHRPSFLVREDYLNIVRACVEGGKLHLNFRKLRAKISPNYDKMSDVTQAMNRAQGLRVSLDLAPGQEYGQSTNEVVLAIPEASLASAGQATVAAASTTSSPKLEKRESEKPQVARRSEPAPAAMPVVPTVEERLEKLENLKKKGLVTREEYEAKKKEILSQL